MTFIYDFATLFPKPNSLRKYTTFLFTRVIKPSDFSFLRSLSVEKGQLMRFSGWKRIEEENRNILYMSNLSLLQKYRNVISWEPLSPTPQRLISTKRYEATNVSLLVGSCHSGRVHRVARPLVKGTVCVFILRNSTVQCGST